MSIPRRIKMACSTTCTSKSDFPVSDNDDPFDKVFLALDRAFKSGLDAGKEHKELELFSEGFTAGWVKGEELGKELGLYLGILDGVDCSVLTEKNRAKVAKLRSVILEFQPLNFGTHQSDIQKIRGLFKRISSNLKLSLEMEIREDTSF